MSLRLYQGYICLKNVNNPLRIEMANQEKQIASITTTSPWIPFRYSIFKMLWFASVVSNVGTWMHEVGASWLMTTLTSNRLLVALIQTATSLSIFLFALPGGIIADIIDKRRYLIVLQTAMMVIAGLLAALTFFGDTTPELLLLLTFCLGAGSALSVPTWQAVIPELVPSDILFNAILLNGIGINISRALGPALGGLIIALAGPSAVFAINTISFLGIILALSRWQRKPIASTLPAERFFSAMRAGLRYVKASPDLHHVLIRATAFFFFASAAWALLPLVARIQLHQGPTGYGILFALLGLGAVASAFILNRLRQWLNVDLLTLLGALVFAVTLIILALSKNFYISCCSMFFSGIAWMIVLSALNTTAQQAATPWIRARVLSVYFVVFFGNMALGSVLWGAIANEFSISTALLLAGIGLALMSLLTQSFSLQQSQTLDHRSAGFLPIPAMEIEPEYHQGPILVTVEYIIQAKNHKQYQKLMREIRLIRLREGAFFWDLFTDLSQPNRFLECFMTESWLEHLRQHERTSISDRKIIERAKALHEGSNPPLVTHFVAQDRHEVSSK
jgi:MFS family permease